jgi:hypothetical protein
MAINPKYWSYFQIHMAKVRPINGFIGGAYFLCRVRFSLALIRALNGAFLTIFLRSHKEAK